jgi:eukaryotic-like serine/threonine-protein kinase
MQFWNELEGRVFDGLYPLRRLMRSEGRTAWFETETGDGQRAVISLTESLTDVDEVVKRLEAAQRLQDPNLLAIFKVGRARFDKALFVYALMEHTEQNLSDVLREQALSKEDVQQVADTLVAALTTLHQHGLLHGRVEPASILAVGETVKLRSDCLQTPGSTRAGDVAGIGETLFQAFTQRKAERVDDGQINRLPAPFAEIVRNSLSSRWSLAQVAAALRPSGAVVTPPPPAMQVPPPVATAIAAPAKPVVTAEELPRVAQPASPPISPSPTSPENDGSEIVSSKSSRPIAVYIALAVVLVLITGWLIFRHKPDSAAEKAAPPTQSANLPAAAAPPPEKPDTPAPPVASTPAQTAGARPAKPSATRSASTQAASAAAPSSGTNAPVDRPVWRVIAFTYNREDQAQRKTEEISQAHADLQPSVLSVSAGDHPRFLVTVGGAMDRSHAQALRDQATALGLPADTYIENFRQ